MVRALCPLLVLTLACGGPNDETLIDELRVVAMVAEPPEVGPAETLELTTLTHLPEDAPIERMTWTCIFQGSGCAEAQGTELSTWVHLEAANTDAEQSHTLEVPALLAGFLDEANPELRIPAWTLACDPGLCPLVDEVRANPAPGTASYDAIAASLANPFEWMQDLPKEGVSLATRTLVISNRDPAARNQNPVLTPNFTDTPEVAIEGSKTLEYTVEDEDPGVTVWGYTTRGGFESVNEDVENTLVELSLFAPKEPEDTGTATLYVIANDNRGGTDLWIGSANITE